MELIGFPYILERRLRLSVVSVTVGMLVSLGCAGTHPAPSLSPRPAVEVRGAERVREPTPVPVAPRAEPVRVHHVVQPGQTLWRISQTYGLPLDELARHNGITDPTKISVGDRLLIPGAVRSIDVPSPAVATAASGWAWPVRGGEVLSRFGAPRRSHRHTGVDIRGRHGQPVVAVGNGRVVYSGSSMRGYGKTVIVDHGEGLTSLYAHNSSLLVRPGQRVRQGEPIARIGRTGRATAEHCHLEIRRHDVPQDPLRYVAPAR